MDAELARFFTHWVPLLRGERGVSEVEGALGQSRSRPRDLGFYRTLMERNTASILTALFPATRAAFIAWAPGHWLRTVASYERAHPASGCEPNEFGRYFPQFVSYMRIIDGSLPAALEELADYEWLSYALGAGIPAEASSQPSPESYALRQYDHDVPALATEIQSGRVVSPATQVVLVLYYRERDTGRARALYPSRAAVLALARCAGVAAPSTDSEEALDAAERELTTLGVFG